MPLIIDTHVFIWFISGSSELNKSNRDLIEDEKTQIFISIASLWEISIKNSLGKLEIRGGYKAVLLEIEKNNISILPIEFNHTLFQNKLPFHHKDPFDRMIASQAIIQNLDVISDDKIFDMYFNNTLIKQIF